MDVGHPPRVQEHDRCFLTEDDQSVDRLGIRNRVDIVPLAAGRSTEREPGRPTDVLDEDDEREDDGDHHAGEHAERQNAPRRPGGPA